MGVVSHDAGDDEDDGGDPAAEEHKSLWASRTGFLSGATYPIKPPDVSSCSSSEEKGFAFSSFKPSPIIYKGENKTIKEDDKNKYPAGEVERWEAIPHVL